MARPDADHASPGPLAHERPEAIDLEEVAEDIAVGTCELVRQRDHRSGRRLWGIRKNVAPPRHVVPDALARQFFQEKRRYVAAAVEARVNNQCVAVDLGKKAAMEFGKTPRTHIGDVQISDAARSSLVYPAAD